MLKNETMTMMRTGLVACLLLGACSFDDAPGGDGGFDHKDQEGTTKVRGLATLASGEPARSATVYLLGERTHMVQTDAETGEFVFEGVSTGSARLVLNDGRGAGALLELVLFEGGAHDVGEVSLSALESFNQIVDVRGVGFEERVTKESGNYSDPVYSSDATFVVAKRRGVREVGSDIVSIDTATGVETLILEGQDIADYTHGTNSMVPYVLHDDRYLVLSRYPGGGVGLETIVHDVRSGDTLWSSVDRGFMSSWVEHAYHDGVMYMVGRTSERDLEQPDGGFSYSVWQARVDVVDVATGAIDRGPAIPAENWNVSFLGMAEGDDLLVSFTPICDFFDDFETFCSYRELHALDVDAMSFRRIHPHIGSASLSADGARLVMRAYDDTETSTAKWARLDFPGASQRDVVINGPTSLSLLHGISPDGSRVILSEGDYVPFEVDVETGDVAPLALTPPGGSSHICATTRCSSYYLPGGEPRVLGLYDINGDRHLAAHTDPLGASTWSTFDVSDDEDVSVTSGFEAIRGGSDDVFILREDETGFLQLFVDDANQEPRQRTFLTADHEHPAFSADGSTLFYFTRDPISGYDQLFRLDLTSLPTIR